MAKKTIPKPAKRVAAPATNKVDDKSLTDQILHRVKDDPRIAWLIVGAMVMKGAVGFSKDALDLVEKYRSATSPSSETDRKNQLDSETWRRQVDETLRQMTSEQLRLAESLTKGTFVILPDALRAAGPTPPALIALSPADAPPPKGSAPQTFKPQASPGVSADLPKAAPATQKPLSAGALAAAKEILRNQLNQLQNEIAELSRRIDEIHVSDKENQ